MTVIVVIVLGVVVVLIGLALAVRIATQYEKGARFVAVRRRRRPRITTVAGTGRISVGVARFCPTDRSRASVRED
jgi:hypothetical protein